MGYATIRNDVQQMFGKIAPRYDWANSVLSLGIHHLWRRTLVGMISAPAGRDWRVLDLCTGTADLVPALERRFGPTVGADLCLPMMQAGKGKLVSAQVPLRLVQADGLCLPFASQSFDLISCAFGVRNFEHLEAGLCEIRRVLKPGGSLLVLEFGQPKGVFGALYGWYSRVVLPRLGGWLTGDSAAYHYLPETAKRFPAGELFAQILERTQFSVLRTQKLCQGIAYAYLARA